MRTFIALELPKEIKKYLKEIQKDLREAGIQAKWVEPKNAHLTLAFLGWIKPEKTKEIEKILQEVCFQISPIKLYLLIISGFPNPKKARVIYVELGGEIGKLNSLALKIRKRLIKKELFTDQKPFVAHLTLGRFKDKPNLTKTIKKVKIKRKKFVAKKVVLYQSKLTRSGPIYKKIHQVDLSTTP